MSTPTSRRGEKIGWTGGILGGFLWVLLLAIIRLFQGEFASGFIGLILFAAALFLIGTLAPWRRPATSYWMLFLPIYVLLGLAVAWAVWIYQGLDYSGFSLWNLLILPVFLIPFFTAGRRRWTDGEPRD
jgi:hypothetical protein